MAKNTTRLTINNMPLTGGLATAGQQGTVDEGQLWRAINMVGGYDGLLKKRPGIRKWGQTLVQPAPLGINEDDRASIYTTFIGTDDLNITTTNEEKAYYNNEYGRLYPFTLAGAGESVTFGRVISPSEIPIREVWSTRLTFRAYNLEDRSAEANGDGGYVEIIAQAAGTDGAKSFGLFMDGVYYYDGAAWVQLVEAFIGDARYHTVELRCDPDGDTVVYIDDSTTAAGTVASSSISVNTTLSNSDILDIVCHSGTGQSSYELMDLVYKDCDTCPFVNSTVRAITGFRRQRATGTIVRTLLVATNSHVYADVGLNLAWSPILTLTGDSASFCNYRGTIIIFDSEEQDARVLQWDGTEYPDLLDDAPPCKFGTEHQTRLVMSGDANFPQRVYYSASRQPNVFFAPEVDPDETYNEVVNAGYVELNTSQGIASCTAVQGEFDGTAIFTTDDTLWQLVGYGPQSYRMIKLERNSGAAGNKCMTQVNRTMWMLGRDGIASFPDVAEGGPQPSAAIADLWSTTPSLPHAIDLIQVGKSVLVHDSGSNTVLMGVPELGETDVSAIYAYNTGINMWYGPWETDAVMLASVEVADPVMRTVALGTDDGRVGILMPAIQQDFADDNYTATFESPYLSGRSLDPRLTQFHKTWNKLRLYIQPRGDWDLDVTWQTDGDNSDSVTVSQNAHDYPLLGYSWRLDDDPLGRVHSEQRIAVIDITLDSRGSWLKFWVSTADDHDGEMFSLLGYEVDFEVAQYTQE